MTTEEKTTMSQITRRTMLSWMGAGAGLLAPMYWRLRAEAAGVTPRPILLTLTTKLAL